MQAAELGVIAALDDRPRAGRDPVITAEAKTWLVALGRRKAKELGYPHELSTTRLLAAHAQQQDPPLGIRAWENWPKGRSARSWPSTKSSRTKCATTWNSAIPSSSPRWPRSFVSTGKWRLWAEERRAGVKTAVVAHPRHVLTTITRIQAIATTAPDRPPLPGTSPTVMRDHDTSATAPWFRWHYDLLTGHVHALVKERHRSREFIEFLSPDAAYPADTAIEVILDHHSAMSRARPQAGWLRSPLAALPLRLRRRMGHGSISSRASSPSWRVRCCAFASPPNTN